MCGIIGYLGHNSSSSYIINGLFALRNRGYDSAGICTLNNMGKMLLNKYASENTMDSMDTLVSNIQLHKTHTIGIGHTRWATHGGKTNKNAHPHIDYTGKFSIVHNGIIENCYDIKNDLENNHKIKFQSDTDTEVIINLISFYFNKTKDVKISIDMATKRMQGTWGIVIMYTEEPTKLYCVRHGSPLLVGFGSDYIIVASEQSGFCGNVLNYVSLNNDEIISLTKSNGKIIFDINRSYELTKLHTEKFKHTPDPYTHWTLKEINEQYDTSIRSINMGGRLNGDSEVKLGGLESHKDLLLTIDNLILLGCGTSYFSGLYASRVLKEISGFNTVQIFDGAEFSSYDIPMNGKTGIIFISQSGETKDLHRCLKIANDNDLITIGVINVVDSMISKEVMCGTYLNAGREVGVASTKAFTAQVIVLTMIAVWFSQYRNLHKFKRQLIIKSIRQLPQDIKKTIADNHNIAKQVALYLKDKQSCFVLGKGQCEAVAKEGALKLKEIGYIHAEGYSTASLKHGPFALLTESMPVIILNPHGIDSPKIKNAVSQVASRNSVLIGIVDSDSNISTSFKYVFKTPQDSTFKGIMSVIPLQLISYELALIKGHNPDFPRNIAKCVTVE